MKWPLCILKREGLSDNTLFVIQRPEAFLVIYHILCKLHLINHISILFSAAYIVSSTIKKNSIVYHI